MRRILSRPEVDEKAIVGACLDLLHIRGWKEHRMIVGLYWRAHNFGPFQGEPTGTPDYLCVHPRWPAFYLETKRPRPSKHTKAGGLSPIQQYRIREIEQGRHLKVITIADPRALTEFLYEHEKAL